MAAIVRDAATRGRVSGQPVVAYDDLLALDADHGTPWNGVVCFAAVDAEALEPGVGSDAEAGDAQLRRGQLAAEIVAAADRTAGLGYHLASQQRGECPHRPAPGILSKYGRSRSSPRPRPSSVAPRFSSIAESTARTSLQGTRTRRPPPIQLAILPMRPARCGQ